ncbi:hypothetical protein BaRGS_00014736 [Batillaria attramentaria]|uniref:Uncharacterized protein n=1 Tax=Batillaria attramentaria TaxID=370345 RepID=A0ABD0L3I0_9CAEN
MIKFKHAHAQCFACLVCVLQLQFFVWGWSLTPSGKDKEVQHLRQVTTDPLPIIGKGEESHHHHHGNMQHSFSSASSGDADDATSTFLTPAALWESSSL